MKIGIDRSINLIQEVRLIHSLSDLGYELYCNRLEYEKLLPLIKKFGLNIHNDTTQKVDISFAGNLEIDHSKPYTKFLKFNSSLVFSESFIDYCYNLNKIKEDKIYFRGLITGSRDEAFKSLKPKITKELIIESNKNGRIFPVKSFDEDYFISLSRYKFSFCPDGDFTWSYRFFESIMCGSIPIIENNCPLFDDFYYYKLSDNLNNLSYHEEWCTHNLKLLKDKFTLKND
jgi:hypothetical protein